jgi:hypothetical protein
MRIRIALLSVFLDIVLLLTVFINCSAQTISPSNPVVNQGGTLTLTCTGTCTGGTGWSVSGTNASGGSTSGLGSITSGGVYTAPATVNAQQQLAGYQLFPNNNIFNTRIDNATSGLSGTAFSGTAWNFNVLPSFPINYVNNSTSTDSMVFFYTPGNNGTYYNPSSNGGASGLIESGWYQARHTVPGVTQTDHHYLKANYQNGHLEEQYQYYPAGNGTGEGCPTCNSQSGVKYNSIDYSATNGGIDAAELVLMPLILRRQEFDAACASGAGTGSINHALRLTLASGSIGNTFVWPAQAVAAGSGSNPYGRRFRLKSTFNQSGFSACAQLILTELKNYGLFLADIGLNGQSNIEYAPWSEADVGYMAEVNNANIPSTDFEYVPDASFEITAGSWEASVNREKVCFNSSAGTACTDVNLLGVTVGVTQDAYDIMAGSPAVQLNAVVNGSSNTAVTWTLSSAVGSINSSSGLYTPPATASSESTITATATSSANSAVSASVILRVWPNGAAYALPSFAAGNDYSDSGGNLWKSGAGIGINDQQGQIGCCADYSSNYTGSATNASLWNHAFTGSSTNLVDNHIYWITPAGTYTLTFHSIAPFALGSNSGNVNFASQGSTMASILDFAASGVGQYGPYTRTASLTVTCNNSLTFDEQMYDDGGFEAISSFSIVQATNTQSSCNSQPPAAPSGLVITGVN